LDDLRRSKDYQETAHEMELKALNVRLQAQLTDLDHHLAGKDKELLEAREESELTLFQLHQVQEELEHYFLSDGEKQRQLELRALDLAELRFAKATQESAHEIAKGAQERLHDQELKALRERFDLRLAELEQRLATSGSQLQEAREAAELTVLQLHKLQEELEHHFLNARSRDQLAQAQFEQLQRAQRLMVRLHPDVLSTAPYSPSLAVQVLPDEAVAITNPSLQTEALLSTYAASLQRASALLERARRP